MICCMEAIRQIDVEILFPKKDVLQIQKCKDKIYVHVHNYNIHFISHYL